MVPIPTAAVRRPHRDAALCSGARRRRISRSGAAPAPAVVHRGTMAAGTMATGGGRRAAGGNRSPVSCRAGGAQAGAGSGPRPRMQPCNPCKHPGPMNLLAFDTSTDTLSIAVQHGADVWQHTGPGGARASVLLIPQVLRLMAQAGLSFDRLDALVFGRGPGSFTAPRTARAVAQGLAYGARGGLGLPVLPVDTLLAVAEEARQRYGCTRVVAVLDARMDEVYHARCEWLPGDDRWRAEPDFGLGAPESVQPPAGWTVAGNARARYGQPLGPPPPPCHVRAFPTAPALLRRAPGVIADGGGVPASAALPRYIRDKVAHTTAERAALRAAHQDGI